MLVHVRLNGPLIRSFGQARFSLTVPEGATVQALLAQLAGQNPAAGAALRSAVAVVGGAHARPEQVLQAEQEVALLMPVAGG